MAPSDCTPEVDTSSRRKRPNRLEQAITNPGAVKINVTGAFIVDDEPRSKSPVEAEGVHYENKDIRLPHHTGVVSHVAVDVSYPREFLFCCVPRTAAVSPAIKGP
jgi:type II pantothenate kinase